MTVEDKARWVDPGRSTCLCQFGLPGYTAGIAVGHDGEETLWLFREDVIGKPGVDHGSAYVRHEQVGRLPRDVRERIWDAAIRCGQLTAAGRPCRMKVAEPGQACSFHGGSCR